MEIYDDSATRRKEDEGGWKRGEGRRSATGRSEVKLSVRDAPVMAAAVDSPRIPHKVEFKTLSLSINKARRVNPEPRKS
jgi:hypothetical protein